MIDVNFFDPLINPQPTTGDPVQWGKTLYKFTTPRAPLQPTVELKVTNVEWAQFEKQASNVVNPHGGHIATEALRLAAERLRPEDDPRPQGRRPRL